MSFLRTTFIILAVVGCQSPPPKSALAENKRDRDTLPDCKDHFPVVHVSWEDASAYAIPDFVV